MPLHLALVFHFNQHTHEYAAVANRACYRGLLNVLRAHPALKFNLHISGTLLRALNWFDPETVGLVRAGAAEGQFELLGSTYAQNVPYACDDWDNAQQIRLHREVLHQAFGVAPTVFWNSERTWRQSIVPLIAAGGYTTTLVEDHILRAAGLEGPVPATTTYDEHALTVVYDDTTLRERFNYAAWFGRRAQLFKYLRRLAARPRSERFLVAYAEDAEAMGLWHWEHGYLPHAAWAQLDALLRQLEASDEFALRHLSSARAREALASLPDGAAQWMDRALLDPKARYHEDGYRDWFDFLHRSPKLAYFRKLYAVMRSSLRSAGAQDGQRPYPAGSPAGEFYRLGVETFCHHQYEFGCIGVGGRKYWGWENVRTAFLFARVASLASAVRARHWIEDVNGDAVDEQLLCDGHYLAVFSGHGGRLLYWFDLLEGRQLAGNQLAVPSAPYRGEVSNQPRLAPEPKRWLPDTFEPDLKPWRTLRRREAAPTRLGRLMPKWIFKGEAPTLTVYRKRTRRPGTQLPLRVQIGAFNDRVTVDDGPEAPPDELLDYRMEADGPCYLMHLPHLLIEKRVRQTERGLGAYYTLHNRSRVAHRVRMRSASELCPDYRQVLDRGREALSFIMLDDLYPGVVNNVTRTAAVLEPSREWAEMGHSENLLALEVWLIFDLAVPARSEASFEIQLNVYQLDEESLVTRLLADAAGSA